MKNCKKPYALKNILLAHLRTHYNIKPFVCSFCNKSFNEKGNLKTHIRIHTGERPFKCKKCQKGFKALGQLKDHLISHTGFKPFQCPHCKKFYRRKEILKNHFIIHAKEPCFQNNNTKFQEMLNQIKSMKNIMNNIDNSDSIYKHKKSAQNYNISLTENKQKFFCSQKSNNNSIDKDFIIPTNLKIETFKNINKINLFEKINLNNDFIINTDFFNDDQCIDLPNSLNNLNDIMSSTFDLSLKDENNNIENNLINFEKKDFSLQKILEINKKENDFSLKNNINNLSFYLKNFNEKNIDEDNEECCSKMTNLYLQEFEEKRNINEILG